MGNDPVTAERFDTVVVGSGFGGSTVAYRLAAAGLSVCVLERGRAYPPGSFPTSPIGIRENLWDPSEGYSGLFNVWSFRRLEALVASGLGGGSLIYANVLLRKDERWFVRENGAGTHEFWPVTRQELDPHYDRVEAMLKPQQYPFERAPYDTTPKTRAFQDAAEKLGLDYGLPPLAVTFANPGEDPRLGIPVVEPLENLHGQPRRTCILCGECDTGCNYGSKNTLDYTYLSAAQLKGAVIRIRSEARGFRPRPGGGYSIRYVEHRPDLEGIKTDTSALPMVEIEADYLVLSAGALGTTFLLLKNRAQLPHVSPALGSRFCGNGDLLGIFVRAKRRLDPNRGPVITSFVRVPDALDGDGARGRGYYIEDGGHPVFVNWILEGSQVHGNIRRFGRFAWRRLMSRLEGAPKSDITAEVRSLLSGKLSATSLPVLGMGRDIPDGTMTLNKKGFLTIDWTTKSSEKYFAALQGTMTAMAKELGGRFKVNPTWFLRRVITVHPLGGCPMGRSESEGVVDSYGEVFNHPDLFIADGSVMPGPVGANPSLTIAALADRTADRILEKKGLG